MLEDLITALYFVLTLLFMAMFSAYLWENRYRLPIKLVVSGFCFMILFWLFLLMFGLTNGGRWNNRH